VKHKALTTDFEPLPELIDWVAKFGSEFGITNAWDRPWWFSKKPPQSTPAGYCLTCPCIVRVWVHLYQTEYGGRVWLGQCVSCGAILWSVPG
jgi:hypothetical protein